MQKLVSFHMQAHLNAFLQIVEYFSQIYLGPLARESPCMSYFAGPFTSNMKTLFYSRDRQTVLCQLRHCTAPHALPPRTRTNTGATWTLAHRKHPK
jgi:hypothetical protein